MKVEWPLVIVTISYVLIILGVAVAAYIGPAPGEYELQRSINCLPCEDTTLGVDGSLGR